MEPQEMAMLLHLNMNIFLGSMSLLGMVWMLRGWLDVVILSWMAKDTSVTG